MKTWPILFSAPMVRALLNGSKTQTRRVVKPTPAPNQDLSISIGSSGFHFVIDKGAFSYPDVRRYRWDCPYGQPGDRLWVRETYWRDEEDGSVFYRADPDSDAVDANKHETGLAKYNWRPSIFMPRAASRITLEITAVRVERLQDISGADAQAEGIVPDGDGGWHLADTRHYMGDPISSYASLWEYINGADSWDLNPWVWVIEFKKVTPC